MNGGRKRINVNNWRHLTVLALLAMLFFGVAYWLSVRDSDDRDAEDTPSAVADIRQPLADTERGRQVRDLLSDSSYQKELPGAPKPATRPQLSNPLPEWLLTALYYGLIALGIFALAVFVWVLVTGNKRIRPPDKLTTDKRREQAPVSPLDHDLARHGTLADAHALAADGVYGEAVRALLAAVLISLARRELVKLRPWMTGREIVRDAQLMQEAREALAFLVMTVEAFAFAGHDVARDTYEACLRHHDTLTQKKGRVA